LGNIAFYNAKPMLHYTKPVLKYSFTLILLIAATVFASAQKKTFGVGTKSPNENAVLHVDAPEGNQGLIIPRLSTAQRLAMTLGSPDTGLLVYDTDLLEVISWSGTKWEIAGQSDDTDAALTGFNTGNGFGVHGRSSGTAFASAAVYGEHVGTGDAAGAFRISNNLNTFSALFGETNGSGPAIFANQIGTGRGGQFQINNTSNSNQALRSVTNGVGNAASFVLNNTLSSATAVDVTNNGTGIGLKIVNNNFNNVNPAIWAETNSNQPLSAPIYGLNTGTGDVAGSFRINNASNTFAAVYGETNGSAASTAIRGLNLGGGNGAYFRKNGANINTAAMWADNFGSDGYGAIIQNVGGSPQAALLVEAVGTGPSLWANKDATEIGNSINAIHDGTAGSAGDFRINHTSNTSAAVYARTNTKGGYAIEAGNVGNGRAMSLFNGGMQVSTQVLSGGGNITVRAIAYQIDANTYTFDNTAVSFSEGDIFYFFNAGATGASVNGIPVAAGAGRTIIFLGGSLRGF
jgi:hypothetical protein